MRSRGENCTACAGKAPGHGWCTGWVACFPGLLGHGSGASSTRPGLTVQLAYSAMSPRDVKLDNLLLVAPGDISHIKIADFGFAKKLNGGRGNAMQTVCGTSGAQCSPWSVMCHGMRYIGH